MKMRNLLLAGIAMLIAGSAAAQTTIKPHVGVNLSEVSIDQANVSASGKAGVLAGLSVAFGKKFYFEPGIQYVAKSTEVTNTTSPDFPTGISQYDLKGFRVPLTVGMNFLGSQKSAVTFHGFGGLSAFFITNDDGFTPDLNKTNWGVYAGAGVDIWKIFVDASYEWSLSKLSTDAQVGATRGLFLAAGFRFNLK